MDNNENTNANPVPSSDGIFNNTLCEILILVFIAFLVYYILYDNNIFKNKEGFATKKMSSIHDVDLINDLPSDIPSEYSSEVMPEDHPLLYARHYDNTYDDISSHTPKIKSKKTKGTLVKKEKKEKRIKPTIKKHINPTPNLTASQKSVAQMNKIGRNTKKSYNCNLLGLDSSDMNQFKKNYYGMYAHQVQCPKKCYMNKLGMKKCDLETDKDCNGVFTEDYNNPDVYALGYMALLNNNEKPCVTCTQKPLSDAMNNDHYTSLIPSKKLMNDRERQQQMKVTNANISNYVNFNENVNLDSIGETQVDKLAEMRTCAGGTCKLQDFGKSIKNVYDNLLSTPVYTNRNKCDPYQLTGVNDNLPLGDHYAPYNKGD